MSIKREKILFTGIDMNLKIQLNSSDKLSGLQQEVDEFTKVKSTQQINVINDGEVKRFALNASGQEIGFYFSGSTSFQARFTTAGFTINEVNSLNKNYTNSFFILDFFNSISTTEQTKIFSTYLTKLDSNNLNNNPIISIYEVDESFQWYYLNVPINFISNFDDFITGYSRFSFYDAKSGRIRVFYNNANGGFTTPEKMYVPTKLDLNNKRWSFIESSGNVSNTNVELIELPDSQQYIDKYNNTFDNFNNLQPTYPSGLTFNYSGGTYF